MDGNIRVSMMMGMMRMWTESRLWFKKMTVLYWSQNLSGICSAGPPFFWSQPLSLDFFLRVLSAHQKSIKTPSVDMCVILRERGNVPKHSASLPAFSSRALIESREPF